MVQTTVSTKWAAVTLAVIIVIVGVSVVALSLRPEKPMVTDFNSCKEAEGVIMEMYPEQCRINGDTYVNQEQIAPDSSESTLTTSDYIGLTETEALDKAKQNNVPARVVERDDEMLPVTMDFVEGRLNFSVKDGLVTSIEVEGQASDSPLKDE